MNPNFLDFEQPIAELDGKIQELRHASHGQAFNIDDEVARLRDKLKHKTAEIFRNLTPWQIAQLARHPARPYTLDYLQVMCEEFHELAGDRLYADDPAIVGGLARIDGRAVMVIGHQKGRDTKSKIKRNFGMPRPEGYRKALRLMEMAERFKLPIFTFIDTPGAYPGVGAEERGQSEAIARNLREMSQLKVPIVCAVIGEGGSGGALAIGVGDRTHHAAVLDVFGDHAGRLRVDPVEKYREGARCRRCARHHRRPSARTGPDRQDRARTARRRASRSAFDRRASESGDAQPARRTACARRRHARRNRYKRLRRYGSVHS